MERRPTPRTYHSFRHGPRGAIDCRGHERRARCFDGWVGACIGVPGQQRTYQRNTRENLVAATGKLGLDRRDIPPAVSFFAPVSIDDAGRFQWEQSRKRAGDFVDLRAEMDLLVAISNCPHPLHPIADEQWPAIEVIRYSGRSYVPKDPCRTATAEAVRAFEFTDRLAK